MANIETGSILDVAQRMATGDLGDDSVGDGLRRIRDHFDGPLGPTVNERVSEMEEEMRLLQEQVQWLLMRVPESERRDTGAA